MQDPWHYPRGELAAHLLKVMESGVVTRIAMFAPRRKGKTWFVLRDLAPAAVKQHYLPVFASLWRIPDRPNAAITDGIKLAIEALSRSRIPWKEYLSRLASIGINVGGLGGTVSLGSPRAHTASPDELEMLHASFGTLITLANKKRRRVLLLVDEAQHLATRQAFDSVAKSLRTLMEGIEATRPAALRTLFTGSSRTDLAALLHQPSAAFYQSFESQELPDLDRQYTNFVASQLKRLGRINVDREKLWEVFEQLQASPFYMQRLIRELMLRRASTVEQARDLVVQSIVANPQLAGRWESLDALQKAVYRRVCNGSPLYSRETIQDLRREIGGELDPSVVQAAVRRLRSLGLISSERRGVYRNEDPDLLTWLQYSGADRLIVDGDL